MFVSFLYACTVNAAGGISTRPFLATASIQTEEGALNACIGHASKSLLGFSRDGVAGPPFTYILQNDLKSAEVIDLQLMRLWSVEPNMTKGFGLPNGERIWNCKGKCCVFIADWEQYVRGFDLMGYLALLPCGYCMNVVGRRPDFDDPVFVHILSHEYHRFQLHTPEILFEAADEMQRIAEEEPVRLAVQQTSIGIEYYKEGLLFDKWSRAKLQPLMFGDWMHTFYGSGVFCNRGLRQILP